jgi:tetratricopeptide (TPR) repeat protein
MRAFYSVCLVLVLLATTACRPGRNRDLAERVYELEKVGSGEEEPEKIREIKKEINHWEKELNDAIDAARHTGRFYKTLGLKYMDYKMFGPAAQSFSRAIEITPENARLYYYRAVANGRLAVSRDDAQQRAEELGSVEEDYKRAISLEARFMPPYYSLGVLYIYELGRPFEAAPYLETYLEVERSDGRALLLYGQLLEQMNRPEEAMDIYRRLLSLTDYKAEQEQAAVYMERIREGAF